MHCGGPDGPTAAQQRRWSLDDTRKATMEIWPGTPYPLGATYDGTGDELRPLLRGGRAGRALPDRRRRHRDPRRPDRGRRLRLARLPARRSSPASATASGCTARTTPQRGHRCNPNKLLLDPYAKAIEGQIDGDQSLFSYDFDDPKKRNTDDSLGNTMIVGRHQPVLRLGQRPAAAARVPRDGHLRGARQGPDDDPPRRARGDPRHLRRRSRTRRSSSTSRRSASPRSS